MSITTIFNETFPDGVRGVCYSPTPTDYCIPPPVAPFKYGNTDFWNSDFPELWGGSTRTVIYPDGGQIKHQGDLDTIVSLGFNAIRLYNWQSHAGWANHVPFLNACQSKGIKLIVIDNLIDSPGLQITSIAQEIQSSSYRGIILFGVANETDITPQISFITNYLKPAKAALTAAGVPTFIVNFFQDGFFNGKSYSNYLTTTGLDMGGVNIYDHNNIALYKTGFATPEQPFLFGEYGHSSIPNGTGTDQAAHVALYLDAIYPTTTSVFGGFFFEYSDERYKRLNSPNCHSPTLTHPSDYVVQISPPPTIQLTASATAPMPANAYVAGTGGWLNGNNSCMYEGYFGLAYLTSPGAYTSTTWGATTIINYQGNPWVYPIDQVNLKPVAATIENFFTSIPSPSPNANPCSPTCITMCGACINKCAADDQTCLNNCISTLATQGCSVTSVCACKK